MQPPYGETSEGDKSCQELKLEGLVTLLLKACFEEAPNPKPYGFRV